MIRSITYSIVKGEKTTNCKIGQRLLLIMFACIYFSSQAKANWKLKGKFPSHLLQSVTENVSYANKRFIWHDQRIILWSDDGKLWRWSKLENDIDSINRDYLGISKILHGQEIILAILQRDKNNINLPPTYNPFVLNGFRNWDGPGEKSISNPNLVFLENSQFWDFSDGLIWLSDDGLYWKSRTIDEKFQIELPNLDSFAGNRLVSANGNGRIVIVGNERLQDQSYQNIFLSIDVQNQESQTQIKNVDIPGRWNNINYNAGKFWYYYVNDNTIGIRVSDNGIDWEAGNIIFSDTENGSPINVRGVYYLDSQWVARIREGNSNETEREILVSYPSNIVIQDTPTNGKIVFGNGIYLSRMEKAGNQGKSIFVPVISKNLVQWKELETSFDEYPNQLLSIAKGAHGYISSTTAGGKLYHSTNLESWAVIKPSGMHGTSNALYLDKFYALGYSSQENRGMIWYSVDGIEWEKANIVAINRIRDMAKGPQGFVAVGGQQVFFSIDGQNWSPRDPNGVKNLKRVIYANGMYTAGWFSSQNNTRTGILTSTDGVNWSQEILPNTVGESTFMDMAYGDDKLIMVGGNGKIVTKINKSWELQTVDATSHLQGIDHRDDGFYVVGNDGLIMHSKDGEIWIPQGRELNAPNLYDVFTDEHGVVAVGEDGIVLERTTFSVPVVQSQPEDLSIGIGQDAEILVDIKGPEEMTMQWIKDGVPVFNATEPILTIEEVALTDAGEYWLEISSATGVISTERAILSVNDVFIPPADEDAFVFRAISSGTPGSWIDVQLNAVPEAGVSVYAIEDGPPSNWTVRNISGSGAFDPDSRRVKFGPFFDANARTLSYEVLVPAGVDSESPEPFVGIASADGSKSPIGGDHFLSIGQTHPADLDGDFRMEIGEATGYGAAWKKSETWDRPPNPIPINYATHAGFLWKNGERYRHDALAGDPPLSWVSESETSSAIGLASLSVSVAKRFRNDKEVQIQILLPHTTSAYAVEERLTFDVKVVGLNEEGVWDPDSGVIRWGPFLDRKDRVLKYTIESTEPAGKVSGVLSVDGESLRILEGDPIGNEDSENEDSWGWKLQVDRFQGETLLSWSSSMDYEYRVLKRAAFILNENQHWMPVSEWIIGSGNRMNFKINSDSGLDHASFYFLERRPIMTKPDESKRDRPSYQLPEQGIVPQ